MNAAHLLVVALTLTALAACSGGRKDGDTAGASLDADTQALADELLAASAGFETLPQTADWTGMQLTSGGAHGAAVLIWWNDLAFSAFEAGAGTPLPEGSILVKQGYDDAEGAELRAVTYLWKNEGLFFMATSPDGAIIDAGYDYDFCLACHEGAPDGVLSVRW
jgi:hypothetical protein